MKHTLLVVFGPEIIFMAAAGPIISDPITQNAAVPHHGEKVSWFESHTLIVAAVSLPTE